MRAIYKPLLVVVITVIFFLGYNTFLLDRSLEELKFSLDMITEAESVEDAENVKMVLELILLDKMALKEFDSAELATLEYAYSVMSKGAEVSTRELTDAVISVKHIVKKKVDGREMAKGPVIDTMDRINSRVVKTANRLRDLPAALMLKTEMGEEIDEELLEQAKLYEQEWRLAEAKEIYESLIRDFPNYKEIKFIKLHLGYICQKLGLYEKAEKIFDEVARRYRGTIESKAAEKLASAVKEFKKLADERNDLLKEISSITSKKEQQEAYYKLGMLNMRLLDLREARKVFAEAVLIDPSTELAARAEFNIGWCYKFQDRLDESIAAFEDMIEKYPENKLVMDAKYQLADALYLQGNNEAAVAEYERIAQEYTNSEMGPLSLLHSSMVYLYDDGDLDNAKKQFSKLQEAYPYLWMTQPRGDYAQELMMDEAKAPKGWIDAILLRGAIGFANVVLETSRPETLGKKTPYSHHWTEKDMNNIILTMLTKRGLGDIITSTRIDFKPGMVEVTGVVRLGLATIKCYGEIKAEPARGGLKYTVEKYRFTFGNSRVPVPIPRFVIDGIATRMNKMLTRKEIVLSVEKIELKENDLTIEGFRY